MLSQEEILNELLAEIHNRLAEISKFMEMQIAIMCRLDDENIDCLKQNCGCRYIAQGNCGYKIDMCNDYTVGFSSDKGLYISVPGEGNYYAEPIGDWLRDRPVNEDGRFLTNDEISAVKKTEE